MACREGTKASRRAHVYTSGILACHSALQCVSPARGGGLRQSFAHAGKALDRGYHVLVFPEGGRSVDGRLQAFEPGIGLLAIDSEVPVLPIYIEGLGPLKLRQRSWFRPGTVSVRLGEPLSMEAGEDPIHFTQKLRARMEQLSQEQTS